MAIVFPGQLLGSSKEYIPGSGTHIANGQIFASTVGLVSKAETKEKTLGPKTSKKQTANEKATQNLTPISIVQPSTNSQLGPGTSKNLLPAVDSIVLARVTRINPRQANVIILVVGEAVCAEGFQGLVRVQDVRATEKDKVKIIESFKPGDVVRAQVISIGDQANYYLSTASNELGVVVAASDAGNAMYPVSWREFRDPITGAVEHRKVAKPF